MLGRLCQGEAVANVGFCHARIGRTFGAVKTGTVALKVADVDARVKELQAKGVEFADVIDSGVCKMAFFCDPDGNSLMLHHRYAP